MPYSVPDSLRVLGERVPHPGDPDLRDMLPCVMIDEFLGVKPLQRASINGHGSSEDRRLWKKFQQVMALPEKDRRAVIRLVNSLVETKGRSASRGSR
jgi:hypothetical protein